MQFTLQDLAYFITAVISNSDENPIKIIGDHTLCLLQEQIGHNQIETQIQAMNDFNVMILKSFMLHLPDLNPGNVRFIINQFREGLNRLERDLLK